MSKFKVGLVTLLAAVFSSHVIAEIPRASSSDNLLSLLLALNGVQRLCSTSLNSVADRAGGVELNSPPALPSALKKWWRNFFGCEFCEGRRYVSCPNCDGVGEYLAMGGVRVACNCCRGGGKVVCRECFIGDGYDIKGIRRKLERESLETSGEMSERNAYIDETMNKIYKDAKRK